ncbi:hypothetical protein BD560DRAFT_398500 [Blakeslea trispora]|nr:hypothetical protein BD560DRAFT_398500 [Blakeslea trispora]
MDNRSLLQHDNFRFTTRVSQPKRTVTSKKHRQAKRRSPLQRPEEPSFRLPTPLEKCPPLLEKHVIYIAHPQLQTLAEALGATVKRELDQAVSHVVIAHKTAKEQRLIHNCVQKSIICVSPKWLLTCYATQEYHSPLLFPVEINEDYILNDTQPTMTNPFNADYIDYDALEKTRPQEAQLRMDQFLVQKDELLTTQEHQQEFFYNQSPSVSQEQRKREAEQRNLQAQRYIEQQRNAPKPNTSELTIRSLANHNNQQVSLFGQERLRVWYGEQQQQSYSKSRK